MAFGPKTIFPVSRVRVVVKLLDVFILVEAFLRSQTFVRTICENIPIERFSHVPGTLIRICIQYDVKEYFSLNGFWRMLLILKRKRLLVSSLKCKNNNEKYK
jgi:hypothetical protein